ncbi:hypothetical protein [Agromyces arachidis]|uniref:hypothetical protein n=1 Tax=Agromyces arachidis TaxID=766966 RepID=UPI0040579D47
MDQVDPAGGDSERAVPGQPDAVDADGQEVVGHPARHGRFPSRDRDRDRPEDERAEALKERVYATFTGLAIVLVQQSNVDHLEPVRALLTLLVGIVAITAAGFVADVIAHVAVHGAFPRRHEVGRMLRVSGSAIASAATPLLVLALAVLGVLDLDAALSIAALVYLVTLGLVGFIAVRRTHAAWWKQALALAILVALGLAVLALQQLAHGH